ncbi:MAG: undecaprenyl-diphosphate phosphatase [Acidobacteriota bacterium]
MTTLQAFVLALVQGITEFLPISSSAHLILTPYLFGWGDQGLTFDIVTNTGTLAAVVLYFRRELWTLARHPFAGVRRFERRGDETKGGAIEADGAFDGKEPDDAASDSGDGPPLLALMAVATLPVVLAGLTIYGWLSTDGRSPQVIATTSIVFGLLLWLADHKFRHHRQFRHIGWSAAALIGLAQAFALIPGTSRSGVTLTAALMLGFRRRDAARFCFLIAIPVSLAAVLHDVKDLIEVGAATGGAWLPYAVGFTGSAVSAFLVIGWLLNWVERQSLDIFVVYRVLLGLVIFGLPLVT